MGLSARIKSLLNDFMGPVAHEAQLGTELDAALDVSTSDIANNAVTAAKLASDAVETAKIKDSNVTLGKLATGITPSHVVKFAGFAGCVGGNAQETISIPGVLVSDVVIVTLRQVGVTPRTILTAIAGNNEIVVTFSGDPSNDHAVWYMILRAAA